MRRKKPTLLGIDFTSAPGRRKPIVVARGELIDGALVVLGLHRLVDFAGFERLLREPGPWVGGFDMPFGLPRELVEYFGWPTQWRACIEHYAGQSREELRDLFRQFCGAREPGNKFARRATDLPAGSSPSMKWVNPPVAWMLHAGVIRLIENRVSVPGLHAADPTRLALEAYPGMLARSITRCSYKSDTKSKQTRERRQARMKIVAAVAQNRCNPGFETILSQRIRREMVGDAGGDALDAVLCLVQTAWALNHPDNRFGMPDNIDPLEGWIVGAQPADNQLAELNPRADER